MCKAYVSYGLKLGLGEPIWGCIWALGQAFKVYVIALVQGSYKDPSIRGRWGNRGWQIFTGNKL